MAERGTSGTAAPAQRSSVTPPPPSTRSPQRTPGPRRAGARRPRASVPPEAEPKRARPLSPPRARALAPEEYLARALEATTARSRGIWARRGLASRSRMDRTIQAMLLRQLYLSHFEQRHFRAALEVSEQALALDVLPDVVHQDAARALTALGDLDGAASHLRLAARVAPPSRRAFHYWTLGSVLFVGGRAEEAIGALERAARWGTRDKPLYQGHLALARREVGQPVPDLADLYRRLARVPAGQGYGRFVLGLLAFEAGRKDEAREHLTAFVDRSADGRAALAIALDGEIVRARRVLAAIARGR